MRSAAWLSLEQLISSLLIMGTSCTTQRLVAFGTVSDPTSPVRIAYDWNESKSIANPLLGARKL